MPEFFVRIRALLDKIIETFGPLTFMEVCGTHTVSIFRSGLRSLLPPGLRLISGPGCPVCVTSQSEIDAGIDLADRDCVIATYGDMTRVPGASGSLLDRRTRGARVEIVTSAIQSLSLAQDNPKREVVFLGVGFETTTPAAAVTIKEAARRGIRNFSVLSLHKTVPPVLRALCSNPDLKIDGFLLPGNVIVVAGEGQYYFLARLRKAAVAAGFEPEEIMAALYELSKQAASKDYKLRSYRLQDVPREGNAAARRVIGEVFETCDAVWRGLGLIKDSGLRIKEEYSRFDASKKFNIQYKENQETACQCGEVLSGLLTPPDCKLFGSVCTPLSPVGPCMVSGEGTCGAWYRFNR
jgi:hydrogenase expression/formation protein HypD